MGGDSLSKDQQARMTQELGPTAVSSTRVGAQLSSRYVQELSRSAP
uniref:Bm11805 n=1 Tax=Brugia malayi TaxID=6279 RepID=A0A1I9G7R7_BRUMA|nr:Bm11805 [Brugia malayi]